MFKYDFDKLFDWTAMVNKNQTMQHRQISKYKFIEDQVIKTKNKGIKLKNHVPRKMRVRVRFLYSLSSFDLYSSTLKPTQNDFQK
jgi:uncharacterized membrane protein YgaE (UPF0421/DUF939 family)